MSQVSKKIGQSIIYTGKSICCIGIICPKVVFQYMLFGEPFYDPWEMKSGQ
jgi:hypothetical protein